MGELQGTPLGRKLLERFVKNYNITLSEAELLDVVTGLDLAGQRSASSATHMHKLSRRIVEEAAEQFHDARLRHDVRQQLSLPYDH